jgi:UDP-galactopyranose mutase
MTAKQFMEWAVAYYGQYPEGQRKDVWDYVSSWEQAYLDALKTVLLTSYSSQFKRPPDIEAMNKLYSSACAEQSAREREERQKNLPPPKGTTETDEEKSARLHADMERCGVTMQTKGWFTTVLQYRIDRGDYGPNYRIGPKPKLQEF